MKRTQPIACGALVALALFCAALRAVADEADPATAARADALFREANELYKADHFAEAKRLYDQAFALKHAHDIAANLGYAEMRLGLHRQAAAHLAFAVKNWPSTGSEEKRRFAVERFEAEKKEVGALRIRVSVAGAAVAVDGESVGMAPLEEAVFVDAGPHVVRVTMPGYLDAGRAVTASKGSEQAVEIDLLPDAAVRGGGGPPRAAVFATGAASLALLGSGVVFTVVANGKSSDANRLGEGLGPTACAQPSAAAAQRCGDLKAALTHQDTFANLARAGFIGGGAVGLAAVALAVWRGSSGNDAKASAVRVIPVVSTSQGGLWMAGTF